MPTQHLVVLGAGESGASAARLGQQRGYTVFVSDFGPGSDRYLAELQQAGIAYETGGHTLSRLLQAEVVVKSPGIPDTAPVIREIRAAGIPIISEIEFAFRYVDPRATIVGITGSNGKTTTTLLTHYLLQSAGEKAVAGGNLGDSFARLLIDHEPQDIYVLELSSFQLDGIVDFRPNIAAILNITPDHLDRYGYELDRYADSKLRIGKNQRAEDHLLVLLDEKTLAPALRRNPTRARITTIDPDRDIRGGAIHPGSRPFDLSGGRLTGRHNAMNALFAVHIARLLNVSDEEIQLALDNFQPAPHRMELIPTSDGRTWINDSKATNVDSTYFALEAMDGPTVWIAGGTDKGNDYDPLREVTDGKVHTLICLGLENEKLRAAFADLERVVECRSAAEAVRLANEYARPGDRILLSPACASFDLFKNYVDRGDQFRDCVKTIVA
ncbi:UDP-N-acetylmuramoylalanine--D-glutamate ligase [Lewinella marina]|uniref:UDP-N-acetylmuramoylalanine--D-glutamate ligase n=1 Tax=Neolewinella marina TaxID=438751 RepID=A0A2G0CIX7_9BACT|nr:UDP-N-acetylmuramoyl-L-alanine--D-glutamate ligase [Neolewinella marina]NJB84906.1 UDP-N-acetylmuramoylalanine--D-glutamate ligase [Neolewinella marina]PHK99941.1 UDP-N-acetylmuramoyl-L-alanine--D-glutamate ligase [Neolewinella marina]